MIYVNQKQLDQVEYLIEQSCRGHHVLFDPEMIRSVFRLSSGSPAEKEPTNEATEKHIENLILQPTLLSKKAYLENLSPELLRDVVKTYFSIVENNLFEAQEFTQ